MAAESERNPSSRTPSRRVSEIRRTNYEEAPPIYAVEVWDSGNSDLDTDEANASWGERLAVNGYDYVHLHLDFDYGTSDISKVHVAVQAQHAKCNTWYDVYDDLDGNDILTKKVFEIEVDQSGRFVWATMKRVSRYMRFKVWVDATDVTGSRARLLAVRTMVSS